MGRNTRPIPGELIINGAQEAILRTQHLVVPATAALAEAVADLPDDHPARQAFLLGQRVRRTADALARNLAEQRRISADKMARKA